MPPAILCNIGVYNTAALKIGLLGVHSNVKSLMIFGVGQQ